MAKQRAKRADVFEIVTLDRVAKKEPSFYQSLRKENLDVESDERQYMTPVTRADVHSSLPSHYQNIKTPNISTQGQSKAPVMSIRVSTNRSDSEVHYQNFEMQSGKADEVCHDKTPNTGESTDHDNNSDWLEGKVQLDDRNGKPTEKNKASSLHYHIIGIVTILVVIFLVATGAIVFASLNFRQQAESQAETMETIQMVMSEMSEQTQNLTARMLSLKVSLQERIDALGYELNQTRSELASLASELSVLSRSDTQLSAAVDTVARNYTRLNSETSTLQMMLGAINVRFDLLNSTVRNNYTLLNETLNRIVAHSHCIKEVEECRISDFSSHYQCQTSALSINVTVS